MLNRDEHGRLGRDPRNIPDRSVLDQRQATARRWRYLLAAMLFVVAVSFQSAQVMMPLGSWLALGSLALAGGTLLGSMRG